MAAMSISFTPQALSRPNSKTFKANKPTQKKLPRNPNLKSKPLKPLQKQAAVGIEATTYTRLPPRDENLLPVPSLDPLFREFKLADSPLPRLNVKAGGNLNQVGDGLEKSGKGEKDVAYDSKFNEEKFEVFDEEQDFEEEEDEFEGEGAAAEEYANADGEFEGFDHGAEEYGDEFEGEESEEKGEKEKGVPAIMRCFDEAKIYIKAGDGGDGVVAMRREKFIPYGGPSGGDGGRGGNVYVEVDPSLNSLLSFRKNIHFRAGDGKNGQGSNQNGAKGEDMVVKVAPGTVIKEAGSDGVEGEVLFELMHPGQRALVLPGGRGGRGNASFKSGNNRVPRIAENGEEGAEMWLELELKLVADVGIVGAPNAGKSTLLSAISLARPKIANYPFTTLLPNLGVVGFDYDSSMVVADLPGLLEGAHRGFGLGHEFLRHSERCSVLVHVVDGSSPQPEYEFDAVRLELELFNPELAEKPFLVAYNKMDLLDASDRWEDFKEKLQSKGIEPICMSALAKEGTYEVSCAAYELVKKNMETFENTEDLTEDVNLNHVAEMIEKRRKASIKEYDITCESSSRTWQVYGSGLERFMQMTNWRYVDSERRFQHVLDACGVNRTLINRGIKEGDNVIVGGMEWVWHDAPDKQGGPSSVRKKSSGADRWAEWQ